MPRTEVRTKDIHAVTNNFADGYLGRLDLARNGGGILFCGAGFSADCLNFGPDETLGTGAQLLQLFNAELDQNPPYRNLQNAADALQKKIGDYGLMQLLKNKFTVSNVTSDMVEILHYPWQTIYTTNYDNSLEFAANLAKKAAEPFNNTDNPDVHSAGIPIIHLHGFIHKWDIKNFSNSCVLGAESYSKLTHVKKWLDRFRRDIDQAQIVVFGGFNANDFHLNQAINDLTGLQEKAFFFNRQTAQPDPDIMATQKRIGTPIFIGRAGLAASIRGLLSKDAPKEPSLSSFVKYTPPEPALDVPTQAQIEDLFLYGKIAPEQLARDSSNAVSEYHVTRSAIRAILTSIEKTARIVLLEGYPCDGKSLLTADISYRLFGTRPVYQMRQTYENLLNEVADILQYAPNAALIIENCFDLLPERLTSIARQFDGKEGVLILTSRAVAIDASPTNLALLETLSSFLRIPLDRLDRTEVNALSDLADQIAGWRDFHALDKDARLRFIESTCEASLPHFLMRLLKSDYVASRYREEFNKLSLSQVERSAVIIALYVAYIGENPTVSFLSNAMEVDYGALIDRINNRTENTTFRLVRRSGEIIETVPSIGAENILKNLFSDAEIVDAIVPVLGNLAETRRNPFEQRMFSQIMRFSILSNVISKQDEIDRFFEHNKQESQIRRMPLFWLQWHMAKCVAGELPVADKFLEQGYIEAAAYEKRTKRKFDRRQLDDRRAKFLMLRAQKISLAGGALSKHFMEAVALSERILRQDEPQHYPFETLSEIVRTFNTVNSNLEGKHNASIRDKLERLVIYARSRIGVLPRGYQRDKAQAALDSARL